MSVGKQWKYEELEPLSRQAAEEALHLADEAGTVRLLLRLANTEGDWEWTQNLCLSYTASPLPEIRRAAVQALGDLARVQRQLDVPKVKAALQSLWKHPELRGTIEDALGDIAVFLPESPAEG
ncbi:hypothetical protein MF271_15040 [Deinococcus sp. KNUC1210]|uniref:hypothetical protein n=1 Tax=Deinococcus sp. KNUC1210 TaxID=2917691 RepID=UPI001EF10967|nr:hypothetical protein [Deinococcus sp. KNUC1210]ULH15243.1 hypothetical protein MF271_15040 [Deinococcus sp. KNUC1210]